MPIYFVTWIHLLAVVTLVGGLVFLHAVLMPALQGLTPESHQAEILRRVGRRFRTLAWVSLIALILTGSYSILNESGSARIETTWGAVLMLKLLLFTITFGLMLIHDFIMDPYAPPSRETHHVVRAASGGRVGLVQKAILVMMLSILLVGSYLSAI
ncbi:MAG: CopD family protein [Nitrospirales bacterium]